MTKKNQEAESDLFRSEMNDILRHRDDRVEPYRKKLRPLPLPPEKTVSRQDGEETTLQYSTGKDIGDQ